FFYLICKRNFVVGISATAETETCIGNFDIKWLRRVLKEEYYQMTEWEKKKLKESLLRINSFEEKINRNLNIYEEKGLRQSKDENGFKNVLSLFKRKKFMKVKLINICEEYFLKVNNFENEEDENIYVKKYFEYTALVFLNFILDKDSRSLLFLSNRLMYKKQFQELVGDFVKELGNEVKNEVFFKSLSAKELDLELEKTPSEEGSLLNKLENHNIKTIIFTTYQSAGVGVNIKHKYDEDLNENLEKIDDELNKEIRLPLIYKDIDDIALEIKTNLINSDEEKDKNSDKKIRLVYLTDLLLENGIIDKNTRSSLLNRGNDMNLKKNYSKTYDYIENAIGKFIQGLGRCNRTKVRNKSRNIYIDKRTNKAIENFIPGDRLFIGDFNFLLKKLKKENNTEDYIKKIIASNKGIEIFYKNKYLEEIKILNKKINYIKNSSENNSEYLIKIKNELRGIYEEYMKLRKYILKNPTRNKENYINSQYYFSIDRPISSYKLIGENFDIKKIEFQDEKDENNLSRGTKLNEIFKIPSLNKFCEENIGKFDKNKEIILPYVYQAIYKGMLGEVVIKEIFRIFDIKLKSEEYLIDNGIVEVFDDVSENGSYIDYKNYNLEGLKNRTLFNEIAEERINYKKSYLNSKRKLFIINLIGNNNEFLGNELGFYKYEDIIGKKEKTCKYIESEVVIVSGVLRYKEDRKSLEINKNLMSTLKDMLEGNYEG
uniref:hypothetical protein n=1 Tax=Fusobacterium sp. TaxID=68766 RepID=UPI002617D1B6